jgi:hypothetical protein
MFSRLNAGQRKSPLPARLRWLKAPGGQLYYWGDLPRYRGQQPASGIVIRYQERAYLPESGEFTTISDHVTHEISIPQSDELESTCDASS